MTPVPPTNMIAAAYCLDEDDDFDDKAGGGKGDPSSAASQRLEDRRLVAAGLFFRPAAPKTASETTAAKRAALLSRSRERVPLPGAEELSAALAAAAPACGLAGPSTCGLRGPGVSVLAPVVTASRSAEPSQAGRYYEQGRGAPRSPQGECRASSLRGRRPERTGAARRPRPELSAALDGRTQCGLVGRSVHGDFGLNVVSLV